MPKLDEVNPAMLTDDNREDLEFVAAVPEHMRQDVEHLFFYNPRQSLLIDKIRVAVGEYGTPEILTRDGQIRIGVPDNDMQCLFALDRSRLPGQLAAVVLYLRAIPDSLAITHLAVNEDYIHGANGSHAGMGVRMIEEVRRIARRIKGVSRIELPYRPGSFLQVEAGGQS